MTAIDALGELRPDGQTNIWDGLLCGMETLREHSDGKHQQSLLLLTDGMPNIVSRSKGFADTQLCCCF